jgi:hypothetical protein
VTGSPEPYRAAPGHPGTSDRVNLPPSGHPAQVTGSPATAQKTDREFTQTFDQWISQTTWSLETKFWEDDEHPKERLFPETYSLKLPTTPRITNPSQEHYELGFIQKSTNRRTNPAFEGSRSSTKRLKALTHDPLKEIRRETPSNRRIER